jgi:hypothetical protein
MKKILGILLALCFVLSVTAASAAAGEDHNYKKDKKDDYKKELKGEGKGKYGHKYIKWIWVPGHFEKKVIKKVIYKHHQKIVIKKIVKIWIPGHWVPKIMYHKNAWR